MAPKPWYHKGLRFSCTRCGNCCRNGGEYAWVYVNAAEQKALARRLGVSRGEFLERWCEQDRGWVVLRMDRPACPFLGEDNRCTVYEDRPTQCRTWPFWRENLDRKTWEGPVSERCPGIGTGPLVPADAIDRLAAENEASEE